MAGKERDSSGTKRVKAAPVELWTALAALETVIAQLQREKERGALAPLESLQADSDLARLAHLHARWSGTYPPPPPPGHAPPGDAIQADATEIFSRG